MNFSAAILAHANWKLRLSAQCEGKTTEKIDVAALGKDDGCELGKWLHGSGQQYASDAKFHDLIQAHAAFHRSAAIIARIVAQGKGADALAQVNSRDSEFGKHSINVVGLLMGFRSRYGDE